MCCGQPDKTFIGSDADWQFGGWVFAHIGFFTAVVLNLSHFHPPVRNILDAFIFQTWLEHFLSITNILFEKASCQYLLLFFGVNCRVMFLEWLLLNQVFSLISPVFDVELVFFL